MLRQQAGQHLGEAVAGCGRAKGAAGAPQGSVVAGGESEGAGVVVVGKARHAAAGERSWECWARGEGAEVTAGSVLGAVARGHPVEAADWSPREPKVAEKHQAGCCQVVQGADWRCCRQLA